MNTSSTETLDNIYTITTTTIAPLGRNFRGAEMHKILYDFC